MIRISLCMIVKNEEKVLDRCLASIFDLMDEIIIVDTGSTDRTKEIAGKYTGRIYDFAWCDDFSKARNFAFEKAACDYIYSADADEVLDEENHEKFRLLKENLMPEVEIVQMYYGNQLANGTVYNFDRELRPKLFKRLRNFVWTEPVHETVRLLPLVYDSEIEITHKPEHNHGDRDITIFEQLLARGEALSKRLTDFYARELFVAGTKEQLIHAKDYFISIVKDSETDADQLKTALAVVVRSCFEAGDVLTMYQYAMKDAASEASSEVCCILGEYYQNRQDYEEAILWFYNAAYEQQSILNIRYQREIPLEGLIACYHALSMSEQEAYYQKELSCIEPG